MTDRPVNPRSEGPEAAGPSPAGFGRMLVLGGGYTGSRFAAALTRLGIATAISHRQPEQPQAPAAATVLCHLRFDPANGVLPSRRQLADFSHVLVTIPPDANGRDPVLDQLGAQLAELPLQWLGYLSTTGVYGDSGGAWVDETSATAPGLERSRSRLACERTWRSLGLPLQVFRLPAIYGPGRAPFNDLRQGKARMIHKRGQVFCRIHVDDIVGALLHNLALPAAARPETLILADTYPCSSSETLGYAAHLLGCKLPPLQSYDQIAATMSPMARSFWSENRRVSSDLLRLGLGYQLRYPSFREGYRAISDALAEP
ncbi:MAG: SDR family NAD(P)-dependent oxidoreductase [Cyanobium sp.]